SQWMLRPREDRQEAPEDQLEASLRVLGRQLGDRGLATNNELQFGDQIDHQLPVRAKRLAERITPSGQLAFALSEERTHQIRKGLRQRGIGDVPLVLVELPCGKQTARRHQYLVQFMNDSRFADSRVARDQHQLRRAALDDAVEGSEQDLDLARSSVQLLGDQQPVGRVVFAEREHIDATLGLELRQTALEIAL